MGFQQSSEARKKHRRNDIIGWLIIAALFAAWWMFDVIEPYLPQRNMSVMEQSFWGTFMALMLFGTVFVLIARDGNKDH